MHRRVDVSHRIVDCEPGRDGAARRVDVQRDRLRRRVGFEEEELRNDGRGEGIVDLAIEADDALLEQLGEDVGCGGLVGRALPPMARLHTCPPSAALGGLVRFLDRRNGYSLLSL